MIYPSGLNYSFNDLLIHAIALLRAVSLPRQSCYSSWCLRRGLGIETHRRQDLRSNRLFEDDCYSFDLTSTIVDIFFARRNAQVLCSSDTGRPGARAGRSYRRAGIESGLLTLRKFALYSISELLHRRQTSMQVFVLADSGLALLSQKLLWIRALAQKPARRAASCSP